MKSVVPAAAAASSLLVRLVARIVRLGIGWLFALALVPGILAASVLLYEVYRTERAQLVQAALQTSRGLSLALDRDIAGMKGKLEILATSPAIRADDFPAFRRQAEEILRGEALGEAIALIDGTGQQVVNTLLPFGAALPMTGHPELLRHTFATASASVSDLYIGAAAKRPFVAVEVPVMRDGAVAYALDFGLSAERLTRLLVEQRVPSGWIANVLDARGTVIARTQNPERTIGHQATPDLMQAMARSSEGTMASHTLEGTPSFAAFSRSPFSGWTIVVAMTRDVLYATLYLRIALAALVIAAFLLGGAVLAWIFSRRVRDALQSLEAVTAAAARGDLDATAPIVGPREIARLAYRFNRMQQARREAVAQLRLHQEEIERLAYRDALTRLPNRRLLGDRIRQAVSSAERHRKHVAVCYVDLDGFKPINDAHGHDVGDEVLREVARRLEGVIRTSDTAARVGGDEFVLVLTDLASESEAVPVLTRASEILAQPFAVAAGQVVRVSASIGIAFFPRDGADANALLRHADRAMYEAKHTLREGMRRLQASDT